MTAPFERIRPTDAAPLPASAPTRIERLDTRLDRQPYVLSEDLATCINVALELRQPLLVTGEPGCGKTTLAWEVARQLGTEVLDFYTRSTSVARDVLYTFDSVRRFYDASVKNELAHDAANYVTYQPLGEAIRSDASKVVLIDEVDKAPRDFPNDLLRELERQEFTIAETDPPRTVRAQLGHFILITSNSERRLPEPFLRRCVYCHIPFPAATTLARIVSLHLGQHGDPALIEAALARFLKVRATPDLQKPPGTAELVGWVRILHRMGVASDALRAAPAAALPALSALIKLRDDLRRLGEAG